MLNLFKSIYDEVGDTLVSRGWTIDESEKERPDGEIRKFVSPYSGKHLAWIDALLEEYLEEEPFLLKDKNVF